MKISGTLLKSNLSEIESGLLRLLNILGEHSSEEIQDLKASIERQLRHVHKFKMCVLSSENDVESVLPYELFEDFRKVKLRQRFAERRWRLLLSNQARNRKMNERADRDVASFAA